MNKLTIMNNSLCKDFTQHYINISDHEKQRWQELRSNNIQSWADVWEHSVDNNSTSYILQDIFANQSWTYKALDQEADKIAHWAASTHEEYIGVCITNCSIFLTVVIGLIKAGVVPVLFNIREPSSKLSRLANQSQVRFGLGQEIPGVKTFDPSHLLSGSHPGRLSPIYRCEKKLTDPAVIIFTSGTSGRSKPALFSHLRLIGAGIAWSIRTGITANSRCYIPLPLYHGNGLAIGFASCIESGACAVVRECFSVRAFLPDIRTYECDAAVYIGELWRYLMNSARLPDDANNPLKIIYGNGLTSHIWNSVLERFGIEHVVEHYGASEMPGSALTNWTGQSGYCGFIPPDHPNATDILLVDEQGKPVAKNKPGQALFRVSSGKYRGYLDPKMDEDRLWKNLLEADDLWWKSGDLLTLNTEGFYKFVDRIGDSFRWKGENVATLEVEEALLDLEQISEAVVYGISISGHSGKVGMASILPKEPMDPSHLMSAVMSQLINQLPRYAIPHFIRLTTVPHETTSTLKTRKAQLIEDGFQKIDLCPHYVLSQGKYIFLTHDHLEKIGSANFTLGF